jgi:Na+/H+ antiporter NhaD/arsenite permease-like protein
LWLDGGINIALLGGVVCAVLVSGLWKPALTVKILGLELRPENIFRDVTLLVLTGLSWKLTRRETRVANDFSWFPILEVAKLFAGIFVTIIPAIAILKAGEQGALAGLVRLVSKNGAPLDPMYFWLTGTLSSFLDNAPTYLVFFNTAGGDPQHLMRSGTTLMAISAGAVFFGAMSYIGNAPNFMVRSIAEERGIKMPSFFGYMVYSILLLLPIFLLVTLIWFR